jgi:hypothetical protein
MTRPLPLAWASEIYPGPRICNTKKTVIFPKQVFDFIAALIGKRVKSPVEGIVAQLLLNNGGESQALLAKIDRVAIEMDVWHSL